MDSMGCFSETKKLNSTERIYHRGTQSCVKVKSKLFLKRDKIINLQPLNIKAIIKELEDYSDEEVQVSNENEDEKVEVSEEMEDEKMVVSKENVAWDNSQNHLNENLTSFENEQALKDKTNSRDTFKHDIGNYENPSTNNSNTNLSVIVEEKENISFHVSRKNDSFDFDFSALSLETPVKNKVNTAKSKEQTNKGFEFLTPKVSHAVPSSLSRTALKTPINRTINHKNSTVFKQTFSQKTPFKGLENEIAIGNNETPLLSTIPIKETFKIIRVNGTEYVVLNLLGRGGSSEVFHCFNIENQYQVAVKSVALQNSTSVDSYINEVKVLQQLQKCDKIIKMFDYELVENPKKLLVVLEKGDEDLSTILKRLASKQSHLPMYMILFYWMEMLYAVQQIHSHGIIHSDLKPANFLKAEGGLKLIDFGIASSVQNDMTTVIKSVPEGTCNYISPEALNTDPTANSDNPKYKLHYKSDVWSLGCILYQLVYRMTPFQYITPLWPKLTAITNPDHKINYPDAKWVSLKIINTVQRCLQRNVRLRPSVDELVAEYENILNNI